MISFLLNMAKNSQRMKPNMLLITLKLITKKTLSKTAKSYQDSMDMSPNAIYDQLTSEYGEKFTEEEAQYAIDNLE